MEEYYLIINIGSTSKKYALYKGNVRKLYVQFEKNRADFVINICVDDRIYKQKISGEDFSHAIEYTIELIRSKKIIKDRLKIKGIGLRIVAPGTYFISNSLITRKYLSELKDVQHEAPLHIGSVMTEIENLGVLLPTVPTVAISDSAFHASIPEYGRSYGIATADTVKLDIFRFGYHGISIQSIIRKVKHLIGHMPRRTIVCHLGGGASITAVKNGKSIDTSMGFTPLEGLLMGTRSGDIDVGAVIYLAKKNKLGLEELEKYLNFKSGLLGLSGRTFDVKELLELERKGHSKAKLALEVYIYRVKKYIGAYIAALNGLDLLVFSAAIGERSGIMRFRICLNLNNLGIKLDESRNNKTVSKDGFIHKDSAPIKIAVITTDEMGEIAHQTRELLNSTS